MKSATRGYWTEQLTLNNLAPFISELGRFPTDKELDQKGGSGLRHAVYGYPGGRVALAKALNCQTKRHAPGHWNEKTVLAVLRPRSSALGRLPTQKELKLSKEIGLLSAVSKFGGFNHFATLLGYRPARHLNNHWTIARTIKTINQVRKDLGRFPVQGDLKLLGLGGLSHAIIKQGGIKRMYEKMGIIPKGYYEANDGHLLDSCLECYVDNYLLQHMVPHEVHPRISPRRKYRADFRVGDLWIEILGYPDISKYAAYYSRVKEKKSLYKQLGLKTIFFEFNDFRHKSLTEIERIIESKMPLKSMPRCRRRAGNADSILPKHYWSYFPTLIKTLKPLADKLRRFPTDKELNQKGIGGLRHAIQRYPGGRERLAKVLKCAILRKPRNHWTRSQTLQELKVFAAQLGRFPKQKDFRSCGRNDLCSAVYKHGSLKDFRKIIKTRWTEYDKE